MTSAAIHTISKATLTFALYLTLSTGLITAMDNGKRHTVTVKNYLVQSAITIKKPVQFSDIEHKTYIGQRSCEIAPIHNETFSLVPQNNMSNFKILLPQCYKTSCVDINITKDNEFINIIKHPESPKEKTILITNSSGQELATIIAWTNPAKFHATKILVLNEIKENIEKTNERNHTVIVENLYQTHIKVSHQMRVRKDPTSPSKRHSYLKECVKTIAPKEKALLSILSPEGQAARLSFLLPRFQNQEIVIDLDEDQKNITIKKGLISDELVITDGKNQLAWTFYKTY